MKIIISHDVDHISVSEHKYDLIVPKFIIRTKIEFLTRKISFKEMLYRLNSLFKNKWQNIDELMDFNEEHNIPATFFVSVNKGVGLNYSIELAEKQIKKIINRGFECGVHGIDYLDLESIKKEYELFKQISGKSNFGIRMHYLRNQKSTIEYLSQAGYVFDSTNYGIEKHFNINKMIEFPLHIMDGYELENGKKWQSVSADVALATTIEKIKIAEKAGIEYLTILFHDRYYDKSFYSWKKWYEKTIEYCISKSFEFISYKDAVEEINNK